MTPQVERRWFIKDAHGQEARVFYHVLGQWAAFVFSTQQLAQDAIDVLASRNGIADPSKVEPIGFTLEEFREKVRVLEEYWCKLYVVDRSPILSFDFQPAIQIPHYLKNCADGLASDEAERLATQRRDRWV